MPDVHTPDPSRIFRDTPLGNIQAWPAPADDVSVCVSFYANVSHAPTERAYISQNLNMTAADARNLARVLTEAADHADKVRTDTSNAKTLGSAEAMS